MMKQVQQRGGKYCT